MRISELLASEVVDEEGRSGGRVRDVRIATVAGPRSSRLQIAGVVVGGGPLVHSTGLAEGRARGPWLLRWLARHRIAQARFLAADRVTDWGPGVVTMRGRLADLPRLQDVIGR